MRDFRFVQYVYLGGVIERICAMSDSVEETDPSSEKQICNVVDVRPV